MYWHAFWNFPSEWDAVEYIKNCTNWRFPIFLSCCGPVMPSSWLALDQGMAFRLFCRQAITWTCADLLFSGPLGTSFCQIYSQNTIIFIQEKTCEVVVRKPPAIFFSP